MFRSAPSARETSARAGRAGSRLVATDGRTVCDRCSVADTFFPRLRGLLGRRGLAPGEGLLLRPCSSIHTMFMRFAVDAVFLDRELRVVHVVPNLRPWRLAASKGARSVLELAAGESNRRGIRAGEALTLAPSARAAG
jgi:uncharacterized membrane protein (UPF0127 family)